jgi:hypothetical protein
MSIKLMTLVLERPEPADPIQRFVLLVLADQASEPLGKCWPSIAQISNRTKLSERSVQRAIRSLQNAGWIDIVDGGRREGGRRANDYFVHREAVNRAAAMGAPQSPHGCPTVTPQVPDSHPTGATQSKIPVPDSHPPGATQTPQSSFNPNNPTVKQSGDGAQPGSLREAQRFFLDHQATESEAEEFYDFYATSGWKMNTGRALASWQAAARRWIRGNRNRASSPSGPKKFGLAGGASAPTNPAFSTALPTALNDWPGGAFPDQSTPTGSGPT